MESCFITIDHNKNQGSVVLNGIFRIVEFPLRGEKWDELVANSKFNDKCEFDAARLRSEKLDFKIMEIKFRLET